jgi:hypothetical protein
VKLRLPGAPLVSLLDSSRIEVRAEVQEADVASLRTARQIAWSPAKARYPLRLLRLSPARLKASRLAEARLRFTAAAAAPGSSARVVWASPDMHVPAELLARRQGRWACSSPAEKPRASIRFHAECPGRPSGQGRRFGGRGNGRARQPHRGARQRRTLIPAF